MLLVRQDTNGRIQPRVPLSVSYCRFFFPSSLRFFLSHFNLSTSFLSLSTDLPSVLLLLTIKVRISRPRSYQCRLCIKPDSVFFYFGFTVSSLPQFLVVHDGVLSISFFSGSHRFPGTEGFISYASFSVDQNLPIFLLSLSTRFLS